MKSKKLILLLIVILPFQIYSQNIKTKNVDIKMGALEKRGKHTTHGEFIAWDENSFVTQRGSGSVYTLEKYNSSLKKTFEGEVRLPKTKLGTRLEFFIFLDDRLYIVYQRVKNKDKTMWLYTQSINTSTFILNNDEEEIAQIRWFKRGSYHLRTAYRISRDESKLLIYYNLPADPAGRQRFGVKVFDKSMKHLWGTNITLPYLDKELTTEGLRVDNKGEVYIFGAKYDDKNKRQNKREGKPNYKYHIFSVDQDEKLSDTKITLDDKFITDMQLGLLDDGNLVCAGFYSDKGKFSIKGSYFLKIDVETKKIIKKSTKEFDLDFITQYMTDKEEKKIKKKTAKGKSVEMYQYDLDNLLIREDGGVVLIAEQFYIKVVTYTSTSSSGMTSTRTTYYYYYNDIIVVNITPEGNIEWNIKIPKRQVSTNDGGYYLSYAFANTENKLYFAFHDNPKNQIKHSSVSKVFKVAGKGEVMTLAVVDMNGKLEMEKLYNHKLLEAYTRPKTGEQLLDNELYMFLQGGKGKQRYVKLILK